MDIVGFVPKRDPTVPFENYDAEDTKNEESNDLAFDATFPAKAEIHYQKNGDKEVKQGKGYLVDTVKPRVEPHLPEDKDDLHNRPAGTNHEHCPEPVLRKGSPMTDSIRKYIKNHRYDECVHQHHAQTVCDVLGQINLFSLYVLTTDRAGHIQTAKRDYEPHNDKKHGYYAVLVRRQESGQYGHHEKGHHRAEDIGERVDTECFDQPR